jgi:hypothetical protein
MKEEQKDNVLIKLWNAVVQFTSIGGGIKTFLTLMVVVLFFFVALANIFRNNMLILVPLLISAVGFVFRYSEKIFGLAEKPDTRILFFQPSQQYAAYRWWGDHLLSDDKHKPKELKPTTKFTQPVFIEGDVITKAKIDSLKVLKEGIK